MKEIIWKWTEMGLYAMSELAIALLHRGRFHPVPGAVLTQTGPNVYEVVVPKTEAVRQLRRCDVTPESFDDCVWLVGDEESVQSLGSAEQSDHVVVTVLMA